MNGAMQRRWLLVMVVSHASLVGASARTQELRAIICALHTARAAETSRFITFSIGPPVPLYDGLS